MNILKYYRAKSHPEMEPFPVLKQVWAEEVKTLEDRQYRMSGYQADETYRAYPEATNGLPTDEWPEELREIWESWEEEMEKVQEQIDDIWDDILDTEKENPLAPTDFLEMEMWVRIELPNMRDEIWGIAKLVNSLEYKYNFIRKNDLPVELCEAKYASDLQVMEEAKRIAQKGVEWIENQERLLLGLDSDN